MVNVTKSRTSAGSVKPGDLLASFEDSGYLVLTTSTDDTYVTLWVAFLGREASEDGFHMQTTEFVIPRTTNLRLIVARPFEVI